MGRIKEKQLKKRKEIALKAIPYIDKYGFNSISITQLCKMINVSVGSFYHYFKDKNDIIMELFNLIDEYYEIYVEEDINKTNNSLYALKIFCLKYAFYCIESGLEVCRQISLVPLMSYDEHFMAKTRYTNTLLSNIIKTGQENKQITSQYSIEQIETFFLVMIRGYCFDWCKKNGNYDIVKEIEIHTTLILTQISINKSCLKEACTKEVQPDKNFSFSSLE